MSNPTIIEVVSGSPAANAGLTEGEELISVNGVRPSDVIEYQQLVDDERVELELRRGDLRRRVEILKAPGAPLGIRLSASIFDRVQTCDNHCEFCFIYQLPPGMRKTLYLKDDDYRLSFLYGNFTTLTRFTEVDVARVIEERLGPLYVSIHATDPAVRAGMLRNPRGATSLRWLRALLDGGIEIHGQIVLCPAVNGGDVLDRTCAEILVRYPELADVGIVPLGVSRFGPQDTLIPHTRETARRDLEIIHFWQEQALRRLGRRMFFASDELYLVADMDIPPHDVYEGFAQHENGIGMIRAFIDELELLESRVPVGAGAPLRTGEWEALPAAPAAGYRAPRVTTATAGPPPQEGPMVIVTGEYGARMFAPLRPRLEALVGARVRVLTVKNDFFGGNTAVAGLLTGTDVARALATDDEPVGRYVLPDVCLSGDRFLDDASLDEVAAAAGVPLVAVEPTPRGLRAAVSA